MTASISPEHRRLPAAAARPTSRPRPRSAWQIDPTGAPRLSFGQAYRYPTVAELYQIVSTGPIFAVPNPEPAARIGAFLRIRHRAPDKNSRVRVSLLRGGHRQRSDPADQPDQQRLRQHLAECRPDPQSRRRGRGRAEGRLHPRLVAVEQPDLCRIPRSSPTPASRAPPARTPRDMWVPYVPRLARHGAVRSTGRTTSSLLRHRPATRARCIRPWTTATMCPTCMGAFDSFFVARRPCPLSDQQGGIGRVRRRQPDQFDSISCSTPSPGRTFIASLKIKL